MHDTIGLDLVGMVVDDIVVVRRRAAVHDRLHRLRQGGPRADRRDRPGHRRGAAPWPAAPWSAARPPSTPACSARTSTTSPAPRTGVVEADRPARARPGARRRRGGRPGVLRPALQRLLAGAPRVFDRGRLGAGPRRPRARPHPRRGAAGADPGLRRATCSTLARTDGVDVHALSHVTGGGLAANLARVLPRGLRAAVDRSTWTPPPVFELVGELGRVPSADLERTLNLGVGMVAVVAGRPADAALARLAARGPGRLGRWATSASARPQRRGRRGGRAGRQGRRRRRGAGRRDAPGGLTARGTAQRRERRWVVASDSATGTPPPCGPGFGEGGTARPRCPVVDAGKAPAGRSDSVSARRRPTCRTGRTRSSSASLGDRLRRAVRRSVKLSLMA